MKLAERMDLLGTETAFEVLAKARMLEAAGKDIIHLEIGEPDFSTPAHIVEAGIKALSEGDTHYGPSPGFSDIRDAIAEEVSLSRGVSFSGENVVVTPGGKPIMFFALLAMIDPGDEVLYPTPGVPIYEAMIRFTGGVPIPMQLHESLDFNLNIEEVASSITDKTKMIIINSPNNPCGSIVSSNNLKDIAELAVKHDLAVLSDEIYIRFLYEGEHISISTFPGMKERTIILDGFSKSYAMTGWRAGYGVMPYDLVEPISRLVTNSVSCTASFTQKAMKEALIGSQIDCFEMVAEFKKRRDAIVEGLNKIPGIRCALPRGAFYAFPNVEETGMDSQTFADRVLEEAGVACLSGESFGSFGKGFIRFSFANSLDNIQIALDRIDQFVRSTG